MDATGRTAPLARLPFAAREVLIAIGASVLLALSAKVEIPSWPVPMTMETFAVLAVGATLGARRGGIAVALWLAEGAFGLPVFAGATAGLAYMAGPTGGYLAGFLVATLLVGWCAERGARRRLLHLSLAMAGGLFAIYLFGVIGLAPYTGPWRALTVGVVPFLPGDVVKLLLAARMVTLGKRFLPG